MDQITKKKKIPTAKNAHYTIFDLGLESLVQKVLEYYIVMITVTYIILQSNEILFGISQQGLAV